MYIDGVTYSMKLSLILARPNFNINSCVKPNAKLKITRFCVDKTCSLEFERDKIKYSHAVHIVADSGRDKGCTVQRPPFQNPKYATEPLGTFSDFQDHQILSTYKIAAVGNITYLRNFDIMYASQVIKERRCLPVDSVYD